MLGFKNGVDITGLRVEMLVALICADSFFAEIKKDCVVTSGLEGTHSVTSLHYNGLALDFRIRHLNETEIEMFVKNMVISLPQDFDVVREKTHVHIEYQPKR